MVNDPIADMLTRIRNASMVGKDTVLIPDSRLKRDILKVIQTKGYVEGFLSEKEMTEYLTVKLSDKKMQKIERVSKPGCRVYAKKTDIPNVLQGMGMVVISTSKGVMAGTEAKKQGLGGEIICKIY